MESERVYEILTSKVRPWNYEPFVNRFVAMGPRLAAAMTTNPHLKVLVAAGHFDLATPPAAIEHSINHLPMDASLRDQVELYYYPAGHMFYTHLPSLEQFRKDLSDFMD